MDKLTYNKGDINQQELITLLIENNIEIASLKIEGDNLIIQPNENTIIANLEGVINGYVKNSRKHILRSLCVDSVLNKDLTAINYKTELKTDVRLDAEVSLTNDGLIEETIYYYEVER